MQTFKIKKGRMLSEVVVPPSKSYANRALVIASLLKRKIKLDNLPLASDVNLLVHGLSSLGLDFELADGSITFKNSFPESELKGEIEIEVGEGGTTARFLAGMCLIGKSRYTLILGDRLKKRPWSEFITIANKLGAEVNLEGEKLHIQGPINWPASITVDCQKTTQFLTAFKLLTAKYDCKIEALNLNSSQTYLAMTDHLLKILPIKDNYVIPNDWSSASYPLAFAALNHEIFFPGLVPDQFQSDSKILNVLEKLNCVEVQQTGIKVFPIKKHQAMRLDVSDCLDIVPTLGYLLSHIEGKHELFGIENLKYKESDRLSEVIRLVMAFGRECVFKDHQLQIVGKNEIFPFPVNLQMPNDHRMVMTATLFMLHHSGGEVSPAEAVNKSYPDFFKIIEPEKFK